MKHTNETWVDTAREFIGRARWQNWKNGGVHHYDSEELEQELVDLIQTVEKEAVERERVRIIKKIDSLAFGTPVGNEVIFNDVFKYVVRELISESHPSTPLSDKNDV